jgi:hypothetical protein
MATKVKVSKGKEFVFRTGVGAVAAKYPWAEWFCGDLLLLERHTGPENAKGTIEDAAATETKDYGVPTNAMHPKIKTAARKRYVVCQVSTRDADGNRLVDSLIIRARPMTAEERVAEDMKRAEEKALAAEYDRAYTAAFDAAKAAGSDAAACEAAGKAARKAAVSGTIGTTAAQDDGDEAEPAEALEPLVA